MNTPSDPFRDASLSSRVGIDAAPEPLTNRLSVSPPRKMIWILAALATSVAGLSLVLVPDGDQFTWLNRANALHVERDVKKLEAQVLSGNHSASTIGALVRARLGRNDLNGSIELLRTWIAEQPDDIGALQFLADVCRTAKRRTDLLDALERLQKHQPTANRQQELTKLYADLGMSQQHLQALAELIDRFNIGTVADYLTLARLRSEHGESGLALQTLDRMVLRFPQALDASVVSLQMKLLLTDKDGAQAMARAQARLQAHPGEGQATAANFGAMLSAYQHPDLALQLLDPYLALSSVKPQLLTVWAQAMADAGQPAQALSRLESFDAAADKTGELLRLRIGLAITVGNMESAMVAANLLGIKQLPPALAANLAARALASGHADLLRRLVSGGDAAIGGYDPVLAAQIALRLGNRASALQWAEFARTKLSGPQIRILQVARLFEQLAEPKKALDVLRRLTPSGIAPASLGEFARLYVTLNQADEGLAGLNAVPLPARHADWHESWALLATASGRDGDVSRWLLSDAGAQTSSTFQRDLMHLAMKHKAYTLAGAVGERLVKVSASDQDRRAFAEVLLAAGRAPEALAQLRTLRQRGVLNAQAYRQALEAAWPVDAEAADELRRDTLAQLASKHSPATQEADIATLQALGAFSDLMPVLESLALDNPQRWLGAFTEAAQRTGRRAPLLALWRRLGESGSTPAELRTQVAFRLIETGDKTSGEQVFRSLASHAGPVDTVTRQLLYVWGPRPQPAQLDWLQARARAADNSDSKAKWMRLLTERGGASRVIGIMDRNTLQADGDSVFEAFLEALWTHGDKAVLRTALQDQAGRTRSAPVLAQMARLAASVNDSALERQLLEAALAAGTPDPQLQKALGLQAYRTHDIALAERWLGTFNAATGGDQETHRIIGEIRLQRHDAEGAQKAFETALNVLERSGDVSHSVQVSRASLLYRLGRNADARQRYEALLAQRPQDDDLRADYVAMLLALGDVGHAQTLLARNKQ